MKPLKYFLYFVVTYCGCSDAAPKEKMSDLACPYIFPSEKDFETDWVTLGQMPTEKLQLRTAGIIYGNATEEKIRLAGVKNRVFSEETIDEWNHVNDTYQASTEYSEKHDENSLMCTYGRSYEESTYSDRNVVLLIPLPPKKAFTCLFIKRKVEPNIEASCKVKY